MSNIDATQYKLRFIGSKPINANNVISTYSRYLGQRQYELSNHLGNVLATVADYKTAATNGASYMAALSSVQDYYPFGMQMPGRNYTHPLPTTSKYRFGFNGMEKDDEVKGQGNSLDFGARIYDSRLGRWLAVDMAARSAPGWSPYRFGFDNPLRFKDSDGNWESDGHFWTVYAMGIAMGMEKSTAREIAVAAEMYDHRVMANGEFKLFRLPLDNGFKKAYNFILKYTGNEGLGTWADPQYQTEWHGLTGGPQKEVLDNAITNVLAGNLYQMHKVGDAWAHSYIDKTTGQRVMYGSSKHDIPGIGVITLEHAIEGEGGKDADKIAKRPVEYSGYLQSLISVFNNKKFKYNSNVTNSTPDLTIFNYMQENGKSVENNTFLLESYISMNTGQTSFNNLSPTKFSLLTGYLDKVGQKYTDTINTDGNGNETSRNINIVK